MKKYLVGGAVRDQLLKLPIKDKDWIVVGSSPQAMRDLGFTPVGDDFPVFLHPKTKEEYALARTERKSGHGYGGFHFYAEPSVTLEDDLIRRDLTINAMALDENDQLIDPFNGQSDLDNRILRHVSDAFIEDPLRVLRVARFAARLAPMGFRVAQETQRLMRKISESGELAHLVAERVWQEIHSALSEAKAAVFFQVLRDCGALKKILPEVDALFGVPQTERYHPEIDAGVHTLLALDRACEISHDPLPRFATLIHDLGKALTPADVLPSHRGHEKSGLKPVKQVCNRLKVPAEYKAVSLLVCEFHLHTHRALELKPATVLQLFERLDSFRKPHRLTLFLQCCQADTQGRKGWHDKPYPQAKYLTSAHSAAKNIIAKPFVEQGLKGKEIGEAIHQARIAVIKTTKNSWVELPN